MDDSSQKTRKRKYVRYQTIVLLPLLLIWNVISYVNIEESHNEYCLFYFKNIFIKLWTKSWKIIFNADWFMLQV